MDDHYYIGDGGPCKEYRWGYNEKFDHDYEWDNQYCPICRSFAKTRDLGDGVQQDYCECAPGSRDWVCGKCLLDRQHTTHLPKDMVPCKAQESSVMHIKVGHWCEALENGWDCMHFED